MDLLSVVHILGFAMFLPDFALRSVAAGVGGRIRNYLRLGTLPWLLLLVGLARAKLVAALGCKIDSGTAADWGLCEGVRDDLLTAAFEMAGDITSRPRVAQKIVKKQSAA